jgi:archaemetzincin
LKIALLPIGDVDRAVLEHLAAGLSVLGDIEILRAVDVPESAYRPRRRQYLASDLLTLTASYPQDRVLGMTDVDMYGPPKKFIFGLAEIRGKSAIVSLNRLKGDDQLTRRRAEKEAFHEIGHTFGLRHCPNRACVMAFSNSLVDTDKKEKDYCRSCTLKLRTAGQVP